MCTPVLISLTLEGFKATWGKMSDLQRHGTFSSIPSKKKKNKTPESFLQNSQKRLKKKKDP